MSGVFKSIGKVFKKVVKVAKKIAIPLLIGAAVVFTGGAALGALPSFASVVGSGVSALGLGSTLTPLVTNALTGAGFGGIIGGKKGAMMGGLMGALGGATMGSTATAGTGAEASTGAVTPSITTGGALPAQTGALFENIGTAPMASAPNLVAATSGSPISSGLLGNPLVTSQILQGIGSGMAAKAQAKQDQKLRDQESANLSVSGGLLDPAVMAGQQPSSSAAFDPYAQFNKWVFDPRQGKLVRQ